MSASIRVRVNGEERTLPAAATVADLLGELGLAGQTTVGVERNGSFVEPASYGEVSLTTGDEVEIVRFLGGG